MTLISRLFGVLCSLLVGPALAGPVLAEHIEAELISEQQTVQPGSEAWVALRLRPDPEWHTYWRNPGDSGLATRIEWQLPPEVEAGEIHWPYPHREALGELTNYGYSGETLHLVPIRIPADWPDGTALELRATAHWLVCRDICIPGSAELSLSLPTDAAGAMPDPVWQPFFEETRRKLPVDAGIASRFDVSRDAISLAFEGAVLPDGAEIDFFPYANDLVNHAAPQHQAWDEGGLRLTQTLSDYFTEAPPAVDGVLVVHDGEPAHAYRVHAQAGPVSPVADGASTVTQGPLESPTASTEHLSLLGSLLFAFLGGLILNLMPCVFPVLSIKAVSLLESGRDGQGHLGHALSYTFGVLACFGLLAAILVGLRGGGDAIGWGFQLQQPLFVAALAYLFFAMGLSLSGVVQFGTRLMGLGQSLTEAPGLRGSFFTGVLAVVVASPCSAPFMGVALGYALTQSAVIALSIFLMLGLGLAAPFLLIGLVPALARLLPRPGAWMETFKQVMAFPLYLTVIWLLWVLGGLTDRSGMALAGMGLVLLAFAAWLWNREGRVALVLKLAAGLAALALLAHPLLRMPSAGGLVAGAGELWEPYSEDRLAEARAQGDTVFVNLTADWCITCKVNERIALSSARVRAAFADSGVVYLKGDWTRPDPVITAVLDRYGRSGVPLYLLYRGEAGAQVLPQLLTPEIVIDALNGAS